MRGQSDTHGFQNMSANLTKAFETSCVRIDTRHGQLDTRHLEAFGMENLFKENA